MYIICKYFTKSKFRYTSNSTFSKQIFKKDSFLSIYLFLGKFIYALSENDPIENDLYTYTE